MGTAVVHTVALARDAGIDEKSAAAIVLAIYVSGFFGRIAFGKLADHISGPRAYLVASAAQTALIFWFTQIETLPAFLALGIALGFGMNAVMTCLLICVREMTPVHVRGVSTGMVLLFGWIGMGLGGYQAGYLFDVTGSYTLSYANSAFAGVVNMIIVGALIWYAGRRRKQSTPTGVALAT